MIMRQVSRLYYLISPLFVNVFEESDCLETVTNRFVTHRSGLCQPPLLCRQANEQMPENPSSCLYRPDCRRMTKPTSLYHINSQITRQQQQQQHAYFSSKMRKRQCVSLSSMKLRRYFPNTYLRTRIGIEVHMVWGQQVRIISKDVGCV